MYARNRRFLEHSSRLPRGNDYNENEIGTTSPFALNATSNDNCAQYSSYSFDPGSS
jgi:hypothetical protein